MLNPQLQQLLNLIVLLFLGKYYAYVYPSWMTIAAVLFVTVLAEHLLIFFKYKHVKYFSYSALSTAIGVLLMLVTLKLWITLVVIVLALMQKHFMVFNRKHFFNPSNFAILLALMLFYHDAHLVLGQLGDSYGLALLVLMASMGILMRVDRWVIPLVFFASYLIFEYLLIVRQDPVVILQDLILRLNSVSMIVFMVFMLTDPKTTPTPKWQQAVFAIILALIAVLLDKLNGFRVQHLFMALFLLTPMTVVVTQWQQVVKKQRFIIFSSFLFIFVISIIIFIEKQAPYYFEMNH